GKNIRIEEGNYKDLPHGIYSRKGVPAVVNTSFNLRGEPIVCSPEDAINDFLKTKMDYLVLGRFLVGKQ
ncbi:MAG: carbamoyltransferase, partial [Candidatus Aenigmarchaeota archaeon]|nr:carbamoyltransferase [Candidatus Aenigmarchaeota archaeon]